MSEKVEVVKIDTQPAQTSLADLRKALKQVKDEMVGMEAGSDSFLEAANKAGELKHQLDEIQQSVAGASSDFGDMLGNVGKVGAGVTGAFQTATAALSMFGVESEEVTKSIKKMQDLMAMTQGLASIDASIKSLNKLRNAITSTTTTAKILKTVLQPKVFVAITAAITALAAIWNKWGEDIKEKIPLIGKIADAWDKVTGSAEEAVDAQKKYNDEIAAAQGKVEDLQKQRKISQLNSEAAKSYKDLTEQLKIAYAELELTEKRRQKAGISREEFESITAEGIAQLNAISALEKQQQAILDNADSYKEIVKKTNEHTATKEAEKDAIQEAIEVEYAQLELKKEQDAEYAKSKKALEDYLVIQNKELDHLKELGKEGTVAYVKMQTEIAKTTNEINNFGKSTKTAKELLEEQLDAIELVEKGIDLQYEQGKITANEYYTQIIAQEEAKLALLTEGTEAWYDQAIAIEQYKVKLQEAGDESKKMTTSLQKIQQVGQIAFGALGDTLSAFADMQDTTTKEGFEQQKKLQIAAVTMNMLGGVMSAWTSAMNPANAWMTIWGQIAAGAAQTVATIAMGATQIAKIKRTTFDGGGSTAGTSANLAGGAQSIVAPVQYTQDINGASIEGAIKDSRVYVTETDITNTQKRVSVAETENRY